MSRIYNKKIDIDSEKVKNFFEKQTIKKKNSLISVSLQAKNPKLSEDRDIFEKNLIIPFLNLKGDETVLEIGCGLGRFAKHIKDNVKSYLGIDFSRNLIDLANKSFEKDGHILFQVMSANNIKINDLLIKPPFNLIMTMGLLMYLNDKDCANLIARISELVDNKSTIYIRESVSIINKRMTLKNFYSKELETNYNAIYRTIDEYDDLFNEFFIKKGFKLIKKDLLLKGKLINRKETNQSYWIFKK